MLKSFWPQRKRFFARADIYSCRFSELTTRPCPCYALTPVSESVQGVDGNQTQRLCRPQSAVRSSRHSSHGFSRRWLLPCVLLPLPPCSLTRARPGVGFLLRFPIGLAFILAAIARRQPAPEHARCLTDKQTKERYESEVGESSLAFLLPNLQGGHEVRRVGRRGRLRSSPAEPHAPTVG